MAQRKAKGSRAANPKATDARWSIRFASSRAKSEWDKAVVDEPDIMASEEERLHARPLDRSDNPRRTHPFKGSRATKRILGKKLPVWQREPTSGGRIWYSPDKDERIVWINKVSLSHPKENE
jgi:hypothetical protein